MGDILKFVQSKRGYQPPLQFQKRGQLFIRMHNEPLSVVAMRIHNPDRSPLGIDC
jgi:hypothetical protein